MPIITDYRPETFDEIIGNKDLVSLLKTIVEKARKEPKKISRVYLFHGKSGCGKTTFARILAKELGCGENTIEFDISDNRGIDDVREIKKSAQYKPLIGGDKKAYILDEIQGMTSDAQQALLKILEEPPEHIYFMLCTTQPEKLLETIRNRCKKLRVKPLSDKQMKKLVEWVAGKEEIKLSSKIIDAIVMNVEGCPRQALDIIDSVRGLDKTEAEKSIIDFAVKTPLEIINLCRALIKGEKWAIVRKLIDEIKDVDVENVRRQVLGYLAAAIKNSDKPSRQMIIAADAFRDNFFSNGKAGFILACYEALAL